MYGFDKLSSPAPHKPEPPEDVYFDRLSVTPGKGNSPWSSPRASHSPSSPSPAVPPTDDDVSGLGDLASVWWDGDTSTAVPCRSTSTT